MKISLICKTLLCAILLVGCGNKTDANEKNFSAAITDELKKVAICLPFENWPYRVIPNDSARMGQMTVLEAAGLVSGADFEANEHNYSFSHKPTGHKIKLRSYSLTEEGKRFFHKKKETAKVDIFANGNLCYGKLALDKVIKWEMPSNQMAAVTYTIKLDSLADWIKTPALQAAFPGAAKFINKGFTEKEHGIVLKLTNLGWEPGMPFGMGTGIGSDIVTPDFSLMNPADNYPVALPVAPATVPSIAPSVPNPGTSSPPTIAVGINGNWQGTYELHGHAPTPFTMVISNLSNGVFDGSASEQVVSAGTAETIQSKLTGTISATTVVFTKVFSFKGKPYSVKYSGVYDPITKRIQGKWKSLTGTSQGSFLAWR